MPLEARYSFDCTEAEIRLLLRLRQIAKAGEWDRVELDPAPLAIVCKRSSRIERFDHPQPAALPGAQ